MEVPPLKNVVDKNVIVEWTGGVRHGGGNAHPTASSTRPNAPVVIRGEVLFFYYHPQPCSVFSGGRGRAGRIFRRRSLHGLCGAPLVAMPDGHDDSYHGDGG